MQPIYIRCMCHHATLNSHFEVSCDGRMPRGRRPGGGGGGGTVVCLACMHRRALAVRARIPCRHCPCRGCYQPLTSPPPHTHASACPLPPPRASAAAAGPLTARATAASTTHAAAASTAQRWLTSRTSAPSRRPRGQLAVAAAAATAAAAWAAATGACWGRRGLPSSRRGTSSALRPISLPHVARCRAAAVDACALMYCVYWCVVVLSEPAWHLCIRGDALHGIHACWSQSVRSSEMPGLLEADVAVMHRCLVEHARTAPHMHMHVCGWQVRSTQPLGHCTRV